MQVVPGRLLIWFTLSAIIVIIDAVFVLNRPETLAGGKYYWFFKPYQNYYKFDTLYAMNDDLFVVIQSWLNIIEAGLSFLGVLLCLRGRSAGGLLLLVTSALVFWKTVIFLWYDTQFLTPQGKKYTLESIMCYYFPSSIWIVMPLWSIAEISGRIVKGLSGQSNQTKPKKL